MKILIATPLYPPDIAGHAPYVKELALRLREKHQITILAFNHIPEHIDGVDIVVIEKQKLLPVRITEYVHALIKTACKADVVYVQNGPSTELSMILAKLFVKSPFVLRLGDETPLCHGEKNVWYKILLHAALLCSHNVILHLESSACALRLYKNNTSQKKIANMVRPCTRPEILPFEQYPQYAFELYEASWKEHVQKIETILSI